VNGTNEARDVGPRKESAMRSSIVALTVFAALLVASPAFAGVVGLAVGAYGGMSLPLEDDATVGTVVGAKLRVLPPIPMIGVEAWYGYFGYEDPEEVHATGDYLLAVDGDGFGLFGLDVLIGGVRGVPGFKWYGIVGVTSAEFEEFGADEKERKLGGEVGVGLEITPPAIGLGIEGRGTIMFMDLSGDSDDKMMTLTVGINYYF
jgi:hypothetical protein